jgi:hypothetical protein
MKGKYIGIMALLLAASSVVACGSDDDGGGDGAAALASCNAYCDAAIAKSCADSADCKSFECEGTDMATGPCATEFKRYYDCMKAAADVCAPMCTLDIAKCM